MNLLREGAHAAADWLIGHLRTYREPVAVFLRGDGELLCGAARNTRRPAYTRPLGTFDKGMRYADAVAELTHHREQLQREHLEDMAA